MDDIDDDKLEELGNGPKQKDLDHNDHKLKLKLYKEGCELEKNMMTRRASKMVGDENER